MGSSGCSPSASAEGYCTPAMFHQMGLSVSSKVNVEMSTARTTSAYVPSVKDQREHGLGTGSD
ncbi:hypothetical protein TRAPUB_6298 [Trametes pubescens]|uniref:Uncharacterized protein n=1 Tax=Trametes pubescens TaxID=154538 RepID=A0A1M2V6B8_TRAPU|nr:hypothetical protein TRAPUB_6298 [Trametes pubescens]